jgi:hypothetical protein
MARVILSFIMKAMNAGKIAFRDQFRLSRQPMLHFMAGQRTLIHIAEVGAAGHFIRRGREISFILILLRCRCQRAIGRFLVLIWKIIVLHKGGLFRVIGNFKPGFKINARVPTAFCDQACPRVQRVLPIMDGSGALIHIGKVSSPRGRNLPSSALRCTTGGL